MFGSVQRWIGTVRGVGNRKSRKSELAQKTELGNRKSEFFFGNRKSEIGRKKTSEIGIPIHLCFCVPLKPEHRHFFLKILLPLHKPRTYLLYFAQLSNCVALFIEKDISLVKPTFDYLLGKWPKDYSAKEVLLITEIEEILSRIGNNEFKLICKPLFRQLGGCASSLHFRVAERSLQLWNSETILSLITPNYSHLLFPIMLPALFKANEANHWKNEINNLKNITNIIVET
uniref:Uncharacterized protein n=1 Tax=Meloidogyne incognita TaxID=6306 RepID=A0A914LVZ8_MELIC